MTTLREQITTLPLSPAVASELASDISTVESQLASPNPKRAIIRDGLHSVKRILEGVAANVGADWIPAAVAAIQQFFDTQG